MRINQPVRYYRARQADLASFARTWARNIREQSWLRNGVNPRAEKTAA